MAALACATQARTAFEDSLAREYREIIHTLPVDAMLGEELSEGAHSAALPTFYKYFDLCNEQAYLQKRDRIRKKTWAEWLEGIHENLSQPAFARAWTEIARRAPNTFDELREIVQPQS